MLLLNPSLTLYGIIAGCVLKDSLAVLEVGWKVAGSDYAIEAQLLSLFQ